jgi:DNA transformation protein and related proteins
MARQQKKAAREPDSFTTYVLDQLSALGPVEARPMFGGQGIYWRDAIFGLIDDGRLYFRVSAETTPAYVERGAAPFEPWPGHVMKGYYEVPSSVLEDADETVGWARTAWALPRGAARRKKAAGKSAARKAPKAPTRTGKR